MFFVCLFIVALSGCYYTHPYQCQAIIKDFRWLRVLHYCLTFCLGIALAMVYEMSVDSPFTFLINVLLALIGIALAALFCIVMNNIADLSIDKISNPDRPLVTGVFSKLQYEKIGKSAGFAALLFGVASSLPIGGGLFAVMAIYYFYSVPPIRFKKIFLLSKLSISLNSLIMLLMGYYLYAHHFTHLPYVLFPIYLIAGTLAANMIDIKDGRGDKANGINTLPNTWGMNLAISVIEVGFLLAYGGFYFLQREAHGSLLIFLVLLGLIQVLFLLQKPYNEKSILLFYLISLSGNIVYLVF